MKTVNKLTSLFLCLALLIAVLPINQVYASTSESSQRSTSISEAKLEGLLGKDCTSENIKEAKEDIAFLNALHTDASYLTEISEKDDRLTYVYEFPNITSEVSLNKSSDGTTLYIWEGNLYNELLISDSGEIYLNGKEVTYSVSVTKEDNNENLLDNSGQIKGSVFDDSYSATCPYGTESNYAVYSHTNSCADVALGQFLMSLTFIAFNAVVIAMLPAWIGVAASVAEATFTYFVDNDPYSTGASYRDYRYTHYTKGWWVSDTLAVQKCSIYLYSNANYTGSNSHKTVYYSHEFTG